MERTDADTGRARELGARCREVPLTTSVYLTEDVVIALLETVIDYQQQTTAVERAMRHFVDERAGEIRSMSDLKVSLARFPDTKEGNVELAMYLWGYRLWTRAQQLRGLVAYFDDLEVSTIDGLRDWASTATFNEFEGQVKGLGPAIYRWLVMRLGVETVKPDVHVLRFVARAVGRPVSESEAVEGLEEAAKRLGVKANILDWSIWEYERSAGSGT
jgi:hypothetical protein